MTAALLNPSLALQSRVSIPAPGARLSADLFQPATPAGWAMPTYRPGDPLERFFLGRGGPPGARCRLGGAGFGNRAGRPGPDDGTVAGGHALATRAARSRRAAAWAYHLTLGPRQTQAILNFVTGQPSKAAVIAKASQMVGLPPNALQCMPPLEQSEVVNFSLGHVITPTAGLHGALTPGTPQTISAGGAVTFTIAPEAGYRILDVGVDAVSKGPLIPFRRAGLRTGPA